MKSKLIILVFIAVAIAVIAFIAVNNVILSWG